MVGYPSQQHVTRQSQSQSYTQTVFPERAISSLPLRYSILVMNDKLQQGNQEINAYFRSNMVGYPSQ